MSLRKVIALLPLTQVYPCISTFWCIYFWFFVSDALIVRALYDFDAINDDDLSFRKGDKLEVDEETR